MLQSWKLFKFCSNLKFCLLRFFIFWMKEVEIYFLLLIMDHDKDVFILLG